MTHRYCRKNAVKYPEESFMPRLSPPAVWWIVVSKPCHAKMRREDLQHQQNRTHTLSLRLRLSESAVFEHLIEQWIYKFPWFRNTVAHELHYAASWFQAMGGRFYIPPVSVMCQTGGFAIAPPSLRIVVLWQPHACNLTCIGLLALRQRVQPDESHNGILCTDPTSLNADHTRYLMCILIEIYCQVEYRISEWSWHGLLHEIWSYSLGPICTSMAYPVR
jgi:hypothetical protein